MFFTADEGVKNGKGSTLFQTQIFTRAEPNAGFIDSHKRSLFLFQFVTQRLDKLAA